MLQFRKLLANIGMNWTARIGHSIEVRSGNRDLGPAPQASVAILFLALARRGESWSERSEVCAQLYPDRPDRAALRQTLARLRKWLGEGALEEDRARFRLSPGRWGIEFFELPLGGLRHPWLLELQQDRAGVPLAPDEPSPIGPALAGALLYLARRDIEGARSMLVAIGSLAFYMPHREMERLFLDLRPRDRRDSNATEFFELQAYWAILQGHLSKSIDLYARALRIARHRKHRPSIIRVESLLILALLEAGKVGEAAEIRAESSCNLNARSSPLLAHNTEGMFLWNSGLFEAAVASLSRARRQISSSGRSERLHFLSNFAVLCSEAGAFDLMDELVAEAEELLIPDMDWLARSNLDLATGLAMAVRERDPAGLQKLLRSPRSPSPTLEALHQLYFREASAEAMAALGKSEEARLNWARCVEQRHQFGGRLTPRLIARQSRIKQWA